MLSLDEHLAKSDLHLHQRPVHAAITIAQAYDHPFDFSDSDADIHPEYSAGYIVAQSRKWYEKRYADRTKTKPTLGFCLIPLRTYVWKVEIPFFYGEVYGYIDRRLSSGPKQNIFSRDAIPVNILDHFEDMTQTYADGLSDEELQFIDKIFVVGLCAMKTLDVLSDDGILFRQARADYTSSVEALDSVSREYGKARRDTATCCEKIMKGLLDAKGVPFGKNHRLSDLAVELNDKEGLNIDLLLVEKLYTDANVSYGDSVTKNVALEAHHHLLEFIAALGKELFKI